MTMYWVSRLSCRTYFFLALFPAILFLLALASFFPLSNTTDDVGRSLGPFVSPQVLALIQEQMRRLANNENGGLLTFGVAGALWSSSAALVSIVGALNRAYDIDEGRPWWKVRLVAIGLTLGVALIVLIALSLVLVGPTLAEKLGQTPGWGAPFEWTWLVLQWPLVFVLVATGIGLIYYFGPDADQDWVWITPGAVAATILWLLVSLLFKIYVANFTDYEGSYGTVGGVIVGTALVLHLRHRHPDRRGAERRDRTRLSLRKSPGSEERARKAPDRRPGGASVSAAAPLWRASACPACSIAAATAETWIGCGGCRRDLDDEVVESPWRCRQATRSEADVMTDPSLNPSLRDRLNDISTDVQLLASQTLALARLEVSAAASKLAWSAIGVLASVFVAVAGAAALVSALVLILVALGLPAWAASTLVGLMLTGAGAICARHFVVAMRSSELGMKETRESLRETMEWLKLQTGA